MSVIAAGMADWPVETWITLFAGILAAWARYETWRNKQRATEAKTAADEAKQELSAVSAKADVADAKATIANTRVGNVAQIANSAQNNAAQALAALPPQPWYPAAPTDGVSTIAASPAEGGGKHPE